MERQEPDCAASLHDNSFGCFTSRVGSYLQQSMDQRSMVSTGANTSYQLPGASGSHPSRSDLCKGEIRHYNPLEIRQYHCSRLHQQNGGNSITYAISSNQGSMVMVHGRNILLQAQHLPGALNSIADRESRTWSDRSEWKLSPALFQRSNMHLGPLSMDQFVSRLSAQLPAFISWKPDPLAI